MGSRRSKKQELGGLSHGGNAEIVIGDRVEEAGELQKAKVYIWGRTEAGFLGPSCV